MPESALHQPDDEEQQAAVAAETLDEALATVTAALREHWSTGAGRRLRQIVWSIYTASTLVSLGDVLTNFDRKLGAAVGKLIQAKIAGALDDDDILRRVLEESGEFARYAEAAKNTPEDEEVLYPPVQLSADQLRRIAESATKMEGRVDAERRAEQKRYEEEEEAAAKNP